MAMISCIAKVRLLVGFFLTFVVGQSVTAFATEKPYYFGVVPQQSASRLARMWLPLIEQLSKDSKLDIRFATTKDIPTFETCLALGAYDFAYMNPYHYTVFHELSGYDAFAHQAQKKMKGIVVVRKDSSAKSLADLYGKTLAFPSPAAFGASVLPRAEMRKNGIVFTPQYVKSHDSVYRSVAAGLHAGGGGVGQTFNSAPEAIRSQLRILYQTKAYTPHAFAAAKEVPQSARMKLQEALINLAKTSPELLKGIGMTGIEAATDHDWDDVRELQLTQKATEIVREGQTVCRSD